MAMKVVVAVVAVQSGTLILCALRVLSPQRRWLLRSLSGDPEAESPIYQQFRDPVCVQASSQVP